MNARIFVRVACSQVRVYVIVIAKFNSKYKDTYKTRQLKCANKNVIKACHFLILVVYMYVYMCLYEYIYVCVFFVYVSV